MFTYMQYWDIEKLLKYFRSIDIRLIFRTPRKPHVKSNQGLISAHCKEKHSTKDKNPDRKVSSDTP